MARLEARATGSRRLATPWHWLPSINGSRVEATVCWTYVMGDMGASHCPDWATTMGSVQGSASCFAGDFIAWGPLGTAPGAVIGHGVRGDAVHGGTGANTDILIRPLAVPMARCMTLCTNWLRYHRCHPCREIDTPPSP